MDEVRMAVDRQAALRDTIRSLAAKWPSTVVSRQEIASFTGGLIDPGTIANDDARGEGPDGRFCYGRKIFYSVPSLVAWLLERCSLPEERTDTGKMTYPRSCRRKRPRIDGEAFSPSGAKQDIVRE